LGESENVTVIGESDTDMIDVDNITLQRLTSFLCISASWILLDLKWLASRHLFSREIVTPHGSHRSLKLADLGRPLYPTCQPKYNFEAPSFSQFKNSGGIANEFTRMGDYALCFMQHVTIACCAGWINVVSILARNPIPILQSFPHSMPKWF